MKREKVLNQGIHPLLYIILLKTGSLYNAILLAKWP